MRAGLTPEFSFGQGVKRVVRDFFIFHQGSANEPSGDKAAWVLDLVRASGLCKDPALLNFGLGRRVFRPDFFEQAVRVRSSTLIPTEHEIESENQTVPV